MSEPITRSKQIIFWITIFVLLFLCVIFAVLATLPKENWIAWKLRSEGFVFAHNHNDGIRFYATHIACGKNTELTNEKLELFLQMPHVYAVTFDESNFNNVNLQPLAEMPQLKHLTFHHCAFLTSQELQKLAGCSHLVSLDLTGTKLERDAMIGWENCPLEFVYLVDADLVDADLEHIAKFSKLAQIDLRHNPGITDAGVERLTKSTSFPRVDLRETSVTSNGLLDLLKKYPDAKMILLTDYGFFNFPEHLNHPEEEP